MVNSGQKKSCGDCNVKLELSPTALWICSSPNGFAMVKLGAPNPPTIHHAIWRIHGFQFRKLSTFMVAFPHWTVSLQKCTICCSINRGIHQIYHQHLHKIVWRYWWFFDGLFLWLQSVFFITQTWSCVEAKTLMTYFSRHGFFLVLKPMADSHESHWYPGVSE